MLRLKRQMFEDRLDFVQGIFTAAIGGRKPPGPAWSKTKRNEPGYIALLICLLGSYFCVFSSIFLHKTLEVLVFVNNVMP